MSRVLGFPNSIPEVGVSKTQVALTICDTVYLFIEHIFVGFVCFVVVVTPMVVVSQMRKETKGVTA